MIPQKGKTYAIVWIGPYDYNRYGGLGVFNGNVDNRDGICYGFIIPSSKEECFFSEEEIICEIVKEKS